MGRAHCLVYPDVCARLYDKAAEDPGSIYILSSRDYGDGTMYMEVISDKLPAGYSGVYDVILEGDSIRFKKDVDV